MRKMKEKHKTILDAVAAENLTMKEAATRFGVSYATVQYICSKYGVIARRDYAPPKIPLLADKEWLKQKVCVEKLSYQAIADMVGCSRQRVHQRVKEHGLKHPRTLKAASK